MNSTESERINFFKDYRIKNKITYKKSGIHGIGVFAKERIKKGEIIEICPILIIDKSQSFLIDQTTLYNYYFEWDNKKICIALGYGSLYNHSYTPNAFYKKDYNSNEIVFIALTDIQENEEITINYNGDPCCKDKLWFEADNN